MTHFIRSLRSTLFAPATPWLIAALACALTALAPGEGLGMTLAAGLVIGAVLGMVSWRVHRLDSRLIGWAVTAGVTLVAEGVLGAWLWAAYLVLAVGGVILAALFMARDERSPAPAFLPAPDDEVIPASPIDEVADEVPGASPATGAPVATPGASRRGALSHLPLDDDAPCRTDVVELCSGVGHYDLADGGDPRWEEMAEQAVRAKAEANALLEELISRQTVTSEEFWVLDAMIAGEESTNPADRLAAFSQAVQIARTLLQKQG